MKVGVLGTGMVGEAIGAKLVALGHDVKMGSRTATNEKAAAWVAKASASANADTKTPGNASQGTFADAAAFGELVFLCTKGEVAVEVVQAAGRERLKGKILVDISNPLDFSKGMPPFVSVPGYDSVGERLQRELPETKVVKSLNTVNADVMIDAGRVGGDSDIFVSGNDVEAKAAVSRLLRESFGWTSVVDLGDITTARGTENYLPLWLRLWSALKTTDFNIKIVKKG